MTFGYYMKVLQSNRAAGSGGFESGGLQHNGSSVLLLFRHSLVTVEILTELGKAIVDVTQWEYDFRNLVLLFVWLFLPPPPSLKCIRRIGANWVKHSFISFHFSPVDANWVKRSKCALSRGSD